MACTVETISDSMPRESLWTTLDLTSFFGNLYLSRSQELHMAYQQASLVLLRLRQDARLLPFTQHATPRERLSVAGSTAQEATAMLQAAC